MTQLKVIDVIFLLIKILVLKGNVPLYYHLPGYDDVPLEIEGIEIRHTYEDKMTIY